MKQSRAPLVLIEQLIMVLVFALAAALCLRAFLFAEGKSKSIALRDTALRTAEATAEQLKHSGGKVAARDGAAMENGAVLYFDAGGTRLTQKENAAFWLILAEAPAAYANLQQVEVQVYTSDDAPLFSLPVAWQVEGGADNV